MVLGVGHSLSFIAAAIACGLFAATLRTIKWNLISKPVPRFRPWTIRILTCLERFFWLTSVLATAIAAPHPVTFVLLAMMAGTLFVARSWTYREEADSLNRWMRLAAGTQASYPILAESLANGSSSRIACQAKSFSARLMRGESLVDAVRRSKLPVSAETLAAIRHPQPATSFQPTSEYDAGRLQSIDSTTPASAPIVAEQLIYLIVTMFLAWAMSFWIRSHLLDMLDHIGEEYLDSSWKFARPLQSIAFVYESLMVVVAIWIAFAISIRFQPAWLVRWIPWFGKDAIARWRCEVLRTLSIGVGWGNADSELLSLASQTSRNRWIRKRCRQASRSIENGTTLPVALGSSEIIAAKEQSWLISAANNHHLPSAINQLADNITRRRSLTWKLRMSWLVPLAIVLVGIYVMAHIVTLFRFLTGFTQAIS